MVPDRESYNGHLLRGNLYKRPFIRIVFEKIGKKVFNKKSDEIEFTFYCNKPSDHIRIDLRREALECILLMTINSLNSSRELLNESISDFIDEFCNELLLKTKCELVDNPAERSGRV